MNFEEKMDLLIGKLKNKNLNKLKMFVGIDGFVDEIIHVVNKRHDFNNYDRIDTIAKFGERIANAAGLSDNFEFVPIQVKLGGNGPIFANALIEYGVNLTYVGALGSPDIHQVFKPMAKKCKVYSLCDPGHTDAVEFIDGKLMLGKLETLNEIRWDRVKELLGGTEKISEIMNDSDLVGMENWTMVPHMNEVWEGFINEIFPLLKEKEIKPIAFFDLADPEKRENSDILNALEIIGKFEDKFRTVLGLNEKEIYEIAEIFNIETSNIELMDIAKAIYEKLNIFSLVVHPTKCALAIIQNQSAIVEGPFCEKPILTTGAGDNFNAGFCLGLSLNLGIEEALFLGVSNSGYYVRNAKSPKFEDLINFLEKWKNNKI